MNGPEEAQDYLWLTQDLWMENDVWTWANNNPDAKIKVLKTCSTGTCGKIETRVAEYKRCSACHLVRALNGQWQFLLICSCVGLVLLCNMPEGRLAGT